MGRFDIILNKRSLKKVSGKEPDDLKESEVKRIEIALFQDAINVRSSPEDAMTINRNMNVAGAPAVSIIQVEIENEYNVSVGDAVGVNSIGEIVPIINESIIPIGIISNILDISCCRGVLHIHPDTQSRLNLDENHVIVNRGDWEIARELLVQNGYNKDLESNSSLPTINLESNREFNDSADASEFDMNSDDSNESFNPDNNWEDDLPF